MIQNGCTCKYKLKGAYLQAGKGLLNRPRNVKSLSDKINRKTELRRFDRRDLDQVALSISAGSFSDWNQTSLIEA